MSKHKEQFDYVIRVLDGNLLAAFNAHNTRHNAESGNGDVYFMPFEADDPKLEKTLTKNDLASTIGEPGWRQWFVACQNNTIVGHASLWSGHLESEQHRCTLGIGIEKSHRGTGLGKRLLDAAIEFVSDQPGIDWLDLGVFVYNDRAIKLYRSAGFLVTGSVPDRFRVGDERIEDISMSLWVGKAST